MIDILHISDLHFGRFFGFSDGPTFQREILRALGTASQRYGINPKYILATGDLSSIGALSELNEASDSLFAIGAHRLIPPSNVLVCPGNHDIDWAKTKQIARESKKDKAEAARLTPAKFENYLSVFAPRPGAAHHPSAIRPLPRATKLKDVDAAFSINFYTDDNLLVFALNSSVQESHFEEHHYGYVGKRQLDQVDDALSAAKIEHDDAYKIVMVHHPLLAPDDHDGSGMRDPLYFYNWLHANRINLIVHGHQHYARYDRMHTRPHGMTVLGAGSSSAHLKARPDAYQTFNIVRVDPQKARDLKTWQVEFRRAKNSWEFQVTADEEDEAGYCEFLNRFRSRLESPLSFKTGQARVDGERAYRLLRYMFDFETFDRFVALDLAFPRWEEWLSGDQQVVNVTLDILDSIESVIRDARCTDFRRIWVVKESQLLPRLAKMVVSHMADRQKKLNLKEETRILIFPENHQESAAAFKRLVKSIGELRDFALFASAGRGLAIVETGLARPQSDPSRTPTECELVVAEDAIAARLKAFEELWKISRPLGTFGTHTKQRSAQK